MTNQLIVTSQQAAMSRVLIVDDNIYNRLALKGLVEQYQLECDLA